MMGFACGSTTSHGQEPQQKMPQTAEIFGCKSLNYTQKKKLLLPTFSMILHPAPETKWYVHYFICLSCYPFVTLQYTVWSAQTSSCHTYHGTQIMNTGHGGILTHSCNEPNHRLGARLIFMLQTAVFNNLSICMNVKKLCPSGDCDSQGGSSKQRLFLEFFQRLIVLFWHLFFSWEGLNRTSLLLAGDVLQLLVSLHRPDLLPGSGAAAEGLHRRDSTHVHAQGRASTEATFFQSRNRVRADWSLILHRFRNSLSTNTIYTINWPIFAHTLRYYYFFLLLHFLHFTPWSFPCMSSKSTSSRDRLAPRERAASSTAGHRIVSPWKQQLQGPYATSQHRDGDFQQSTSVLCVCCVSSPDVSKSRRRFSVRPALSLQGPRGTYGKIGDVMEKV